MAEATKIRVEDLEDRVLVNISKALHNTDADVIKLHGERYPIQTHDKGMRYVKIGDVTFMQQNKHKGTKYAELAMQGHEITWGIRPSKWIRIMDGEVTR